MKRAIATLTATAVTALCVVPGAQAQATLHRCSVPHLDASMNGVRSIQGHDASCRTADYFGTFTDPAGPGFRDAGQFWKASGTYKRVTYRGSHGGVVVVEH